ncbi:MAG TPA: hypothetical protein VFQ25_11335 [Ktedonobacterales bacterium]|nr:hypothetical protein [Ktedonobacterales bacterium]
MNVTDLTNAIISGINDGGEAFLEGTLAAVLPIVWLAILGLHLGRPYILDMIDRFTLRLGADLLWLVYIALRDLMIVSGVVMSFMFFFPDVVTGTSLPITGGLAAATLFAVLLIKLMGDPDHDPRLFSLTTWLLGLGALFYFVPYVLGVQAASIATGQLADIANWMVSTSNPTWALGFAYVSIGLLAVMGAIAAIYAIRTGGRPEPAVEPATTPAA